MKLKHSLTLLAVGALLAVGSVQSQTVIVKDDYTATTSGNGFAPGSGVNTGINPPTTRISGTAAANLRYLQTVTTRAASKYDLGSNRIRIAMDNAIGRFTLSANGATAFDFGPALGATYATPTNPAIYEIRISMLNNATNTVRMSFALSTVEIDATGWDFGLQLFRAVGADAYTVAKRFDSASTGVADINSTMITMQPGTTVVNGAGTLQSFLIRVTDAGQETVAPYNSRIQVSTNNGTSWQYDSQTNTTELPNGFRFDGPARIVEFDQAGNAAAQTPGNIFYDSFSITSIQSPAPPTAVTWTGQSSTDNNWSSVENWGGTAPQAGQPLIFGGTNRQMNTNDITGLDAPYLSFTNGDFSIFGNAMTVSSTISNVAGANTISLPLSFTTTGPKTWNIAAGSVLTLANTTTVETNGDHSVLGGGTLRSIGAVNIGQATNSTANPPITILEGVHIIDGATFITRGGYRIGSVIGSGAQTILTNNATLAITATSGNLRVGDAANANPAQLIIDNSTVTLSGAVVFAVGYNAGSKGVVTQNGGSVTAATTSFAENGAATGTYTIKNGTLTTRIIRKNTAGGTGSIYFDNATIVAATNATSSTFFTGLNLAQIQSGGLTVDAQSDVTIGQVLSGTGGLTKIGSSTLTLTGANTFGGLISINAGALSVGAANALPSTATVNLNGGTLDLASNATVQVLEFAGVIKAAGTYGAIGSGAAHENAQFTGTGILTVTGGGTSTTTVTSDVHSATPGQNVTFTITVTGTGDGTIPDGSVNLYDNGSLITTLSLTPSTGTSATASYSTSTLALGSHPITASWAGNSSYGASTSAIYTENVLQAPVIVSPTTASTVVADAGTNVALTVVLQDSTGVSYQWKKGGVNVSNGAYNNAATVSGSTTATMTLAGVKAADASAGDYTCVASNAIGSVTSAATTLVVNDPAILVQPTNIVLECGSNGCLSVTAAGTTNADGLLLYQWFTPNTSGTAIADATNSTLCFNNIHGASAGSYVVVVSNAFGNSITSQVAVVTVQDTTKPVLVGVPGGATIECSAPLPTAPIVTATDSCDSNPSVTLSTVTNAGACAQSHDVVRTWTATDAAGNTATATQTITVVDTTAPVITLVGGSTVNSECHSAFVDPGYSANDACAGSTSVSVSGPLNINAIGTYTLTYSTTDPCGNGTSVTRVVNVVDTTGPTLVGVPPNTTVECGSIPSAATVTATDGCDGSPTVSMNESTFAGSCAQASVITRTWTATDATGNTSTATQTITVQDTTAPVVTLTGSTSQTVECKGSFSDAGASANDDCAGSLTVSPSGTVNTTVTGDYTLTYSATDPCGNIGTATRVVHVIDSTPPTITLNAGPSTICKGTAYSDPSATALDDCGGSFNVVPSGVVDANVAGFYTITYTATDSANNSISATRVVQVITCADPDIVAQPNPVNYGVATGSITLNVQVSGTAPFTYQWYQWKVGQPAAKPMRPSATFVGSTTASLTLTHLSATGFNGTYFCVITNGVRQKNTSENAVLTVVDAPKITITAKPSKKPLAGFNATLTAKVSKGDVTVDGIVPKYQWYFKGAPLAGQTDKVLSLSQIQTNTHWGEYTFYVTNAATVGSATLLLDVQDDTVAPGSILIKSPRDKSKMTKGLAVVSQNNIAPAVDISGTAVDRGLITSVFLFRTNPISDFVQARFVTPDLTADTNAVAGKTLTWLAQFNLVDGTNIFYAVATDSRGNTKASKAVSYYYMGNPATLTIETAPVAHPVTGTKDAYFGQPANGATLDIGHTYSIKASGPTTFVKWEDFTDPLNPVVLSTGVNATFTMHTNMVLKATWTK